MLLDQFDSEPPTHSVIEGIRRVGPVGTSSRTFHFGAHPGDSGILS